MSNYLLDNNFLIELHKFPHREIYARITSLTVDEKQIEYIEGKITGGSINVDGSSAVRRTCNLTMIAKDVKINDFYWGLTNKFKLEIGLLNTINFNYPEIIWFKQGIFVITSFNTSQSNNNYTISISGKDKGCLINGDIAGKHPYSVDYGTLEEYNKETKLTTYKDILIKDIIFEMMINMGNELPQNIIINDIEDDGVELLEYRGDITLYLLRNVSKDIIDLPPDVFVNMTLAADTKCFIANTDQELTLATIPIYDYLGEGLADREDPTEIQLVKNGIIYTVAKVDTFDVCGYRLTDLTYAGELIAAVGESVTSILDKIKNMLGNYEYFYDIDGRFIFQKKRNYVDIPWNPTNTDGIMAGAQDMSAYTYSFVDGNLITAFNNSPNLLNVRNDYAVWGKKKGVNGAELPIHMRYAIDRKPQYYKNYDGKIYITSEYFDQSVGTVHDWRELIYQMALDYRKHYHEDDFTYQISRNNCIQNDDIVYLYPNGKTGYEQYYTDLEGFWRQLYNPFAEEKDNQRNHLEIYNKEDYWGFSEDDIYGKDSPQYRWNKQVIESPESLLFWFDFLDTEGDLKSYSVPMIGSRTNSVNDADVNAIYYRDVPNILFIKAGEIPGKHFDIKTGYTYIWLPPYMENLFYISATRKSAKDAIEEALYKYSYCVENITLTTIPVYHLEPNTRIYVRDDDSNINGEYIINKLTIPLAYNGTMSITATKAVSNII